MVARICCAIVVLSLAGWAAAEIAAYATAKAKADETESPLLAIEVWQGFLESKPSAVDAELARTELKVWQKRADEGAEKMNGRWVGAEERRELKQKAEAMAREALVLSRTQSLTAMKKLEEALAIYPKSHYINFILGYAHLMADNTDEAVRYFGRTLEISPTATDAMNNLGVALVTKKDYARGVGLIFEAAGNGDNKDVAQNLYNAVQLVPAGQRDTERMKSMIEGCNLLASKYGIRRATEQFTIIQPKADAREPGLPAGAVSSGSGLIIREDGLILTNRHVVQRARVVMVMLADGTRHTAELVKMDTEQDLALLKIKGERMPFAQFAAADLPAEGMECFAMGYPLADRLGANVKVTQGLISGLRSGREADILTDAKINPGNSGGPLIDNGGRVIGIVTRKSIATEVEDSYGLAVSAGRVRGFLKKNRLEIAPGGEGPVLTPAEIVAKLKPATVCVISLR